MEKVGLEPSHHKTNTYMNPHTTLTMLEYYGHSGLIIRDWSLITGRGGGLQNWRGGHVKFNPYEKGGGKSLSHIEMGGAKSFHS